MHRFRLRIALLFTAGVLVLSGCGGSVAVRSSFAGAAASPPPAGGAHPGLHAKGGGAFAAVLVLGLIVADVIEWASRSPQGAGEDAAPQDARRPLLQGIDRGWVDRGP